jgi:phosphotriesterase-related protein
MASAIPSVTGPIAGPELGEVLVHEHVVCGAAGVTRSAAALAGGFEALIERSVAALQAARAEGLTTMVDATPFDLGRDVELLAEVSRRSGVTILAATGHWLLPSVFMANRSVSELADLFLADLTTGADGTSIRCGVMKVASEDEITPFDRRVLEAVAIAHRDTGAPIITHAAARNRIGEAQAAVFEELGVPPDRVVIGHADDTYDLDYLTGLADRGYVIGMDRIPCGNLPEYGGRTVEDRIGMIVDLVARGYGDRVVVGHDDPIWAGLLTAEDQARHLDANPNGITFIHRRVLPALREHGLDEAAVHRIMVDNPRRWLLGADAVTPGDAPRR